MTSVSSSGGMIIQHFDFGVHCQGQDIYTGTTYFGFFTESALKNQVGITTAELFTGESTRPSFVIPEITAPEYRMVDTVDVLGDDFIEGHIDVDKSAWFFQAHFHEDPVWPGSLGLEAFLQLLKVFATERFNLDDSARFMTCPLGHQHHWTYRGQVLPTDERVTVQAKIKEVRDHTIVADGFLVVDGRVIYQMNAFALAVQP